MPWKMDITKPLIANILFEWQLQSIESQHVHLRAAVLGVLKIILTES